MDFSSLFHDSSKDHTNGGAVRIPADSSKWPEEWKTTYYKTYPRFKKIQLSKEKPHADFFSLISERVSKRDFTSRPTGLKELSKILQYSAGIIEEKENENPRRAHPSAGGRFPLEIYPIIFRGSADLPAGLYHYGIRDHALDVLWQQPMEKEDIAELFTYPWIQNASCAIVITALFWRSQMKYGERGYRYILLEAGHVGQNLVLAAEALGLKCCPLGGTRDKNLEKFIDIDGINESVVYALALG